MGEQEIRRAGGSRADLVASSDPGARERLHRSGLTASHCQVRAERLAKNVRPITLTGRLVAPLASSGTIIFRRGDSAQPVTIRSRVSVNQLWARALRAWGTPRPPSCVDVAAVRPHRNRIHGTTFDVIGADGNAIDPLTAMRAGVTTSSAGGLAGSRFRALLVAGRYTSTSKHTRIQQI
jgi:hypothetical protein